MFTTLAKTPQDFIKNTTNYFSKFPKTETEVKQVLEKTQAVFQTELKNSQDMWKTYQKAFSGDASPNDITKANKKAQELAKATSFAMMLAFPGAVFALPAMIEIAKEYDIDMIPASVAKEFNI